MNTSSCMITLSWQLFSTTFHSSPYCPLKCMMDAFLIELNFLLAGEKSSCSSRFAQNISFVVSFLLVPFFIIAQAYIFPAIYKLKNGKKFSRWKALFTRRRVSGRVSSSNKSLWWYVSPWDESDLCLRRDEKLSFDLLRIQSNRFFLILCLSSHYFDPRKKRHAHEKKRTVTSNTWHWWINGLLTILSI